MDWLDWVKGEWKTLVVRILDRMLGGFYILLGREIKSVLKPMGDQYGEGSISMVVIGQS